MISNEYYNKNLKQFARQLRKHSTFAEIMLWNEVLKNRKLGYKSLRQRSMFNYIGDFFCKDLKLFIELDGATHFEKTVRVKDEKKRAEIESRGYTLLRFKDEKVVEELEKVQSEIVSWIESFEIKYPEVLDKETEKEDYQVNCSHPLSPPQGGKLLLSPSKREKFVTPLAPSKGGNS